MTQTGRQIRDRAYELIDQGREPDDAITLAFDEYDPDDYWTDHEEQQTIIEQVMFYTKEI